MLQLLTETYADKKHSNMKILDESHNFVISVVSPFMQRVGEKLKQSSEVSEHEFCINFAVISGMALFIFIPSNSTFSAHIFPDRLREFSCITGPDGMSSSHNEDK